MTFGQIKRASGLRLTPSTGAWDSWGPAKNNPKTHMRTHLTKRAKKIPVTLAAVPKSMVSEPDIPIKQFSHKWYLDEIEELIGANT